MAQLAPATALPGLVAFAGLAALGHVADLRLVGMMSLARVTAGVGGSLLGDGPALTVMYSITHGRSHQVAECRKAVLVVSALTVPVVVAVGCLVGLWRWNVGGPLALGALFSVPEALFIFEFAVLRGEKRYNRASVLATLRAVVSWSAALTAASYTSSLVVVGAAYLAGLAVVGVVVQPPRTAAMTADVRRELRRTWSNVASYSVAGYALNNGDQYLLDILLGPAAVGVYALGYLLGGGLSALVGEPISAALGPRIFAEWKEGSEGHDASRATATRAGRAVLGLSVVLAGGILAVGYLGLLRPINPSPDLPYVAALVAVGTGIGTAASLVWQNLLYLQGRTRVLSLAAWATLAPMVLAVIVLTLAFGVVGTALATVFSYAMLAGLDWWLARSAR